MHMCFPGGSLVKNLPAIQETWVHSLGREDPLEKEMATHSSVLAWEIPMDRGAWWGYGPRRHKESDTTQQLKQVLCVYTHTHV